MIIRYSGTEADASNPSILACFDCAYYLLEGAMVFLRLNPEEHEIRLDLKHMMFSIGLPVLLAERSDRRFCCLDLFDDRDEANQ